MDVMNCIRNDEPSMVRTLQASCTVGGLDPRHQRGSNDETLSTRAGLPWSARTHSACCATLFG